MQVILEKAVRSLVHLGRGGMFPAPRPPRVHAHSYAQWEDGEMAADRRRWRLDAHNSAQQELGEISREGLRSRWHARGGARLGRKLGW